MRKQRAGTLIRIPQLGSGTADTRSSKPPKGPLFSLPELLLPFGFGEAGAVQIAPPLSPPPAGSLKASLQS